jgi:hypothetical protein
VQFYSLGYHYAERKPRPAKSTAKRLYNGITHGRSASSYHCPGVRILGFLHDSLFTQPVVVAELFFCYLPLLVKLQKKIKPHFLVKLVLEPIVLVCVTDPQESKLLIYVINSTQGREQIMYFLKLLLFAGCKP